MIAMIAGGHFRYIFRRIRKNSGEDNIFFKYFWGDGWLSW
jgi:hypothetical protein